MKDFIKSVNMKCDVCGNDQFDSIDVNIEDLQNAPIETEIRCADCGKVSTLEQLLEENDYIIDANINDLKDEYMEQLQKDLKKMFK